ncbi:MAG: DUF721 domain-containing protein [Verrucomicrobia bacterium]|nr:DUF721 domain-containing protein [Verrucomicrobiota bacterium]
MARKTDGFNYGQWRVQRERAQIDPGPPQKPRADATPVGPTIESLVKKLGIAPDTWITGMANDWTDIVGKDVAAHTRPGVFQGKCLIVYVDSSAWLAELSRIAKRSMLKKLQERLDTSQISDLRLQLDPDTHKS